ncbi:MAG: ATP-binding protein [bacterium]
MLKRIPIFWKVSAGFLLIAVTTLLTNYYVSNTLGARYALGIALVPAVILVAAYTWFCIHYFVQRPVDRLAEGMDNLADKQFDFRLEEDNDATFGPLASSFNEMASMLSSSLRELTKTRDYVRSVMESSADIIITLNPSDKIQTINKGAEIALGFDRFEITGQPIATLFADPRDAAYAGERLQTSDNVVNYETQLLTKGGHTREVLLTLSRLRNPRGAVIGTIGIGKDITQEKRLQHQLIQSQRLAAIGEVFTGIQHSMKNMLNACKGGAYMVRTGLAKDNRTMLEEGWEMVQEGISKMTDLSSDMLKYVKEWKPRIEQADLVKTLHEIDRLVKQTASDRGIRFSTDISPDLPPVACDAKMIHSAVMDIVSNALDACSWKAYEDTEAPTVMLRAHAGSEPNKMNIEVVDNGCGMTEEVIENIFTPFFSTKSKAGTGLGLSITSRMIGVHGGKIEVESKPDKGTTFRIILLVDGTSRNKEDNDGEKSSDSR